MKFLPKIDNQVLLEDITFLPTCVSENERILPKYIRVHCVEKLHDYIFACPKYFYLAELIKSFIIDGYRDRNPLTSQYIVKTREQNLLDKKNIGNNRSRIATLVGLSGTGKSSAVKKVLTTYCTQVIEHAKSKEKQLLMDQLVWLKVDFTCKPTIGNFCLYILEKIDQVLSTTYFSFFQYQKDRERIEQVAKILWIHGVGLLVVDEIHNIRDASPRAKDEILDFLEKISDVTGIPVLLVGDLSALSLLPNTFLVNMLKWNKFDFDEEWDMFVRQLLKYQWTYQDCEDAQEISRELYKCSLGIVDIAVKLYISAQQFCINRELHKLTPEIITLISKERFKLIQPSLRHL